MLAYRAGLSNCEALGKVHWEAPKGSGFNRFITVHGYMQNNSALFMGFQIIHLYILLYKENPILSMALSTS